VDAHRLAQRGLALHAPAFDVLGAVRGRHSGRERGDQYGQHGARINRRAAD
jgi:hypothetical protein